MTAHAPIVFGLLLAGSGMVLYRYCPELIATMAKFDGLIGDHGTATSDPSAGEILLVRALTALIVGLGVVIAAVGVVQSLQ